jgi:hypothetical protein
MKFVITYTTRAGGSAADNVTSGEAAQRLLSKWAPSPNATMHEWVQRCDGGGGFAVIENDSAADLMKDLGTWTPWLEFQLYPVIDVVETAPIVEEALATARAVL